MTMTRKRLIVNAGDLGMCRGITDGILVSHHTGIITSASLMINQPATLYAVERLREAPKLGVGIHLNLCSGAPILPASEVPSLVINEGRFYPTDQLVWRLSCGKVSAREIEAEFRAQIRLMKEWGLTPTHADSEDHLQLHPFVVKPFRRALRAEQIYRTTASRRSHWPRVGVLCGSYSGPLYRRFALTAYLEVLQRVAFRNLESPDYVLVGHPTYRGATESIGEGWRLCLENLPPGTYELTCHPGFFEKGFSDTDDLWELREKEIRVLTDLRMRDTIERSQIELITYSQLECSTQ